jgi:sulfur transfer complex TusBCD TusB component (DsrH family)
MAIAKTAHYIKASDPSLTTSDAVDAALKIINNSYDIRSINGGTYRMKNDIVAPNDQAVVHDSLKRIITNRDSLRNKIQVPEGKTFETYINQAGRQLRWQTNEEEDGVFLVNGGAADSFVLDKQGNPIEYKFSDLAAQVIKTKKEKEEEIVIQTRTRLEERQRQLKLRNTRNN